MKRHRAGTAAPVGAGRPRPGRGRPSVQAAAIGPTERRYGAPLSPANATYDTSSGANRRC
eukprot:1857997-Prymnesium_polylepis.1